MYTLQIEQQYNSLLPEMDIQTQVEPKLFCLLQNYQDVFQTPQRLSPQRVQDHAIHLLTYTTPIKVQPYRYPPSQKAEIEKKSW